MMDGVGCILSSGLWKLMDDAECAALFVLFASAFERICMLLGTTHTERERGSSNGRRRERIVSIGCSPWAGRVISI